MTKTRYIVRWSSIMRQRTNLTVAPAGQRICEAVDADHALSQTLEDLRRKFGHSILVVELDALPDRHP